MITNHYYSHNQDHVTSVGKRQFDIMFDKGTEGFYVSTLYESQDEIIPVIIQNHTNLLKNREEDKKLHFLTERDADKIHIGSVIKGYPSIISQDLWMCMTPCDRPNHIYSTTKIRKLTNRCVFTIDGVEYDYPCILTNERLYDNEMYSISSNTFTDEDMFGLCIPCTEDTSKLKIFDKILIDGKMYQLCKIDKIDEIRGSNKGSIFQMVLLETVFGKTYRNFEDTEMRCIFRSAKLKEAVYNSRARYLLSEPSVVKQGDYVTFIYDSTDTTERMERYITISEPYQKHDGYDSSLCLFCQRTIYLLDKHGNIQEYYLSFSTKSTQLRNEEVSNVYENTTSEIQFKIKNDEITGLRICPTARILIKNDITGKIRAWEVKDIDDNTSVGIIDCKCVASTLNEDDNLDLLIADYNKIMKDIIVDETVPTLVMVGDEDVFIGTENEYKVNKLGTPTYTIINGNTLGVTGQMSGDNYIISIPNKRSLNNKTFDLQIELNGETIIKTITIHKII